MIDFPVADLFDDNLCLLWLERHLHPDGFVCPHCGNADRWRFRVQGYYDAYQCRACNGYYTLLSGTAFEGFRLTTADRAAHAAHAAVLRSARVGSGRR